MNADTLARARRVVEGLAEVEGKATPGPWVASHRHVNRTADDDEDCGLGLEVDGPPPASNRGQFERGADARVIAEGRNALPALLALAEAAAAHIARSAEKHGLAGPDDCYEPTMADLWRALAALAGDADAGEVG